MDVKQEFFDQHVDEIKQELIECVYEDSEIEHHAYLLKKIDNIEEERSVPEVKDMDVSDIKKESCEFVQPKTESELFSLTTHCDLPTLKDENIDDTNYLDHPYRCKHAEIICKPLESTVRHVSKKRRMRYPCPVCSKNCSSSKSRLNHIYGHFGKRSTNSFRSSGKKPFRVQFEGCLETCYYCGQVFLNKSQFLFHLFLNHFVYKITKTCKLKFGENGHCRCKNCLHVLKIHCGELPFKCKICSKPFSRKNVLKKHLKIHVGEKPFKFAICLKQFIYRSVLKRHLNTRIEKNQEKPFKCTICLKQFLRKHHLQNHLIIHTGEKPFKCTICSKLLSRKDKLRMHLKIHTGEKLFECEICLKRFNNKSNLKTHLKIHTGEKSFKCEICLRQFNQKASWNRHLKIHTEKKPYKCKICLNQFIYKTNLETHLKIHTGEEMFKCAICSKLFSRKDKLRIHLKIHTGEKPFKCTICSKMFGRNDRLTRHFKIHFAEKPLECEICSKQFIYKSSLNRHLKFQIGKKCSKK